MIVTRRISTITRRLSEEVDWQVLIAYSPFSNNSQPSWHPVNTVDNSLDIAEQTLANEEQWMSFNFLVFL